MDLLTWLQEVNYIAVLVATIASFLIGFIWYSPSVFGTKWMQFEGLRPEDAKNKWFIMMASFVARFILATVLALLIGGAGLMAGFQLGLLISIGIVASNSLMHYLFAQKCGKHWLIEAGYDIVTITLMAAIVWIW